MKRRNKKLGKRRQHRNEMLFQKVGLYNIIDYTTASFFFKKCCDRLFEIKDIVHGKTVENEMSYTMMLRSGLLLFLIGYPLCLNRYIISAIFFVIRCALVTRKKFYFFLSAVGRRIEWAIFLGGIYAYKDGKCRDWDHL